MMLSEGEHLALSRYWRRPGERMADVNENGDDEPRGDAARGKDDKQKHLPAMLELCVGCRVMVVANVATTLGVVNGAMGSVVGFVYSQAAPTDAERVADEVVAARTHPRQPVVLVQLDEFRGESFLPNMERVVPITPMNTTIRFGYKTYTRKQLPLFVAKARTIHKAQGQSKDCLCMDAENLFAPGMGYVGMSRAKRLRGLWVLHMHITVKCIGRPRPEIAREYARLRGLQSRLSASDAGHAEGVRRQGASTAHGLAPHAGAGMSRRAASSASGMPNAMNDAPLETMDELELRHQRELHAVQTQGQELRETQLRERHALELRQFRAQATLERRAAAQRARREAERQQRERAQAARREVEELQERERRAAGDGRRGGTRGRGADEFHRTAAFRARQSPLFVPFICAVLGIGHSGIARVQAAFEAARAGLWQTQLQAYTAHFAARNYTAATVQWNAGYAHADPYLGPQEQTRLLEPDRGVADALRAHITERVYANFLLVVPHMHG